MKATPCHACGIVPADAFAAAVNAERAEHAEAEVERLRAAIARIGRLGEERDDRWVAFEVEDALDGTGTTSARTEGGT